jgi:muramoyltetrapeptide carboxypeptidase LdcA involved in peptidoglycan recycling
VASNERSAAVSDTYEFIHPAPLRAGDTVAVLSPSWGGPAHFPEVYELGLRRLREGFGLDVVEFPTTRAANATPTERAADLHAAFTDPRVHGVIATIGGDDQIRVLEHLDPDLLRRHLKPFFGYSDNTNLHLFLWNLGIVSYHGGAVMVQFGRPGRMHPATERSLRQALFERGERQLVEPGESTDEEQCDWSDVRSFATEPAMEAAGPWSWHGPDRPVSGRLWGGCLEIIALHLRDKRHLPDPERLDGAVLLIETSEELPSADDVHRTLSGLGELGLLERFAGVLAARPKAWSFDVRNDATRKRRYRDDQHQAVLDAVRQHNPQAVVVLDIDLGHTDPQLVVPSGGQVHLDPAPRSIRVTY